MYQALRTLLRGLNLSLGLSPSSPNNMNFSTHSSFPAALGSMQLASSMSIVYAGIEGLGYWISVSRSTRVWRWWGVWWA